MANEAKLLVCQCAPHHWGFVIKNNELLCPEFNTAAGALQEIENCLKIKAITSAEAADMRTQLEGIQWEADRPGDGLSDDAVKERFFELIDKLQQKARTKAGGLPAFEIKYQVVVGHNVAHLYIHGREVSRFFTRMDGLDSYTHNIKRCIADGLIAPEDTALLRGMIENADLPADMSHAEHLALRGELKAEMLKHAQGNPLIMLLVQNMTDETGYAFDDEPRAQA